MAAEEFEIAEQARVEYVVLSQDAVASRSSAPPRRAAGSSTGMAAEAPPAGNGLRFGQQRGGATRGSEPPVGHGGRSLAPAGAVDESAFTSF